MELENKKTVQVSLAIACLIVGYVFNRGLIYVANATGVRNLVVMDFLPISVIVAGVAAVGLFIALMMNEGVVGFCTEVVAELKKVVWPNKQETTMSTIVVLILVMITGVILWFFDWVWSTLIRAVIAS